MDKMQDKGPVIEIQNLSRWYGEVLGVNHINAKVSPGITGLLGPNGAGKSTLMNLICGLLKPSQGNVKVYGEKVWNHPSILRRLGYCTQYDSFYEGMSAFDFINILLSIRGYKRERTCRIARQALERVNLQEAMHKRLASYSKGMRQRVKLALALADDPDILVLDEPLNGLDAVGRHEIIELIHSYARQGRNILISSHILHEIEAMTDNILMLSHGYLLAEGDVREVRGLLRKHPHKVYLRCSDLRRFASILFSQDGILSVELESEGEGLYVKMYDLDSFYKRLNEIVLEHDINVSLVTISDESIQAVFKYLSGNNHA